VVSSQLPVAEKKSRDIASEKSEGKAMIKSSLLWLLAVVFLATSSIAGAQQRPKVVRIGFLGSSPEFRIQEYVNAFRYRLKELGYVEGQNVAIEYRYADGKFDRLPTLAAELIKLNVDVIFAQAAPAIRVAKEATKTIPIVFETLGDPISGGFVPVWPILGAI
jgi:ABC-type uncharacterized transport system substrate-binding protein